MGKGNKNGNGGGQRGDVKAAERIKQQEDAKARKKALAPKKEPKTFDEQPFLAFAPNDPQVALKRIDPTTGKLLSFFRMKLKEFSEKFPTFALKVVETSHKAVIVERFVEPLAKWKYFNPTTQQMEEIPMWSEDVKGLEERPFIMKIVRAS